MKYIKPTQTDEFTLNIILNLFCYISLILNTECPGGMRDAKLTAIVNNQVENTQNVVEKGIYMYLLKIISGLHSIRRLLTSTSVTKFPPTVLQLL